MSDTNDRVYLQVILRYESPVGCREKHRTPHWTKEGYTCHGKSRLHIRRWARRIAFADMSSSTPTSISTGLSEFREVLGDLDLRDQTRDADPRSLHQSAILAFGRRTVAQPPASVLMQDAVALVAEVLQTELTGIAEFSGEAALRLTLSERDAQGGPVGARSYAAPSDPATSMAGYCISVAEPTVAKDLEAEPRFDDAVLRRLGVVSALTIPLHIRGRVFGVLGGFERTRRDFSDDDIRFAETICHLLAISIARESAEEDLRHQQERIRAILDTVDSLVAVLNLEGTVVEDLRKARYLGKKAVTALQQLQSKGGASALNTARLDAPVAPQEVVPSPAASEHTFEPTGQSSERDLRSSPRRSYHFRQRIAPIVDSCLPTKKNFIEVECQDISAGGIAFFMTDLPGFKDLVVSLGIPPVQSYFTAKIVRCQKMEDAGRVRYLLGCRFTGRVHM